MYIPAGTSNEPSIVTSSGFQSHLIDALTKEHKMLLDGLDNARQFIARSKFDDFTHELKVFKGRFQSHVMAENVKLYIYLRLTLAENLEKREYTSSMRKTMKPIQDQVNSFYKKYGDGAVESENIYSCETELNYLRKVIRERFEEEERKLYPLYKK